MATGAQLLTGLKSVYPYLDTNGTNITNELNRRAAQGATMDQILTDAPGYSEVASGANKQASAALNPAYQQGLNALDLQGNQLDQNANDINNQNDTLGQTLTQNAADARNSLLTDQAHLGLLQGSQTQYGLGKIGSDLAKAQNQSAQQKASQLANIALQRAGLANSKAALTTTYTQNMNDAVQKLLQGSQDALSQRNQQQFTNKMTQADKLTGLITSGGFDFNRAQSDPSYAHMLKQILGMYGFNVTD